MASFILDSPASCWSTVQIHYICTSHNNLHLQCLPTVTPVSEQKFPICAYNLIENVALMLAGLCRTRHMCIRKNNNIKTHLRWLQSLILLLEGPPHPFTHQEEKHFSASRLLPLRETGDKNRKYINHRCFIHQSPNTELLHLHFFFFLLENQAHGLWVASICALLNVWHVFPARISSFTLSCTWRTNQKSNRYFTWSVRYHKHPAQSRFTAVAHSQFTPDWQISLLREAFTVVLHLAWAGRAGAVTFRALKMTALVIGVKKNIKY